MNFRSVLVALALMVASAPEIRAISVLKSSLSPEDGSAISGAKLVSSKRFGSGNDITFCVRFHLEQLGRITDGAGRIVSIMNWRDLIGEPDYMVIAITWYIHAYNA